MVTVTPRRLLIASLVLTAVAYLPVRGASFVYEDAHYLDAPSPSWAVPGRALTQASIDVIGPDAARQHVANVGLHLGNGALLYAVASALVQPWAGVIAATVYLWHPLNSEAVAYVSGRGELLVTLFGLVAVWGVIGAPWRWGITLLALVAAAVSKEVGVVAGLWVLLTIALQRGVSARLLPVLYVGAGLVVGFAGRTALTWIEAAGRGGPTVDPLTFQLLQHTALWHLLALIPYPSALSIDHDVVHLGWLWRAAAVTASTAVLVALVWAWRRAPMVAWGLGVFVASVLPRFVFPTHEFIHEYHLYPAMAGLCVLIGTGLAHVCALAPPMADEEILGVGA